MASPDLPKFTNPPVTETVLGVQFSPLDGFTTAHAGRYWADYLGLDWSPENEVTRLDEYRETFGEEREFQTAGFRFLPGTQSNRIQLVNGTRMVQVQSSRFIYNWIRQEEDPEYPSYSKVFPEFMKRWESFQGFVRESDLGDLHPDHWDVTYVNQLLKDDLWSTPSDWPNILPGLLVPTPASFIVADGLVGEWQYVVGGRQARLRVKVAHGKRLSDGQELLRVQLLARGPLTDKGLGAGLDLGHETIVRAFTSVTSESAHEHWERTT